MRPPRIDLLAGDTLAVLLGLLGFVERGAGRVYWWLWEWGSRRKMRRLENGANYWPRE